ncbi:MAG: cysteine desulfurase CsdA [Gammaproteobacteria bacterium CG_4_10_14_0_8_um_filter_38_16]|nr:MAG: cysteine desulfurase CsdA [Gammaproteobacteria bacterium CG_4_10_14_0_8_um_filter_38_16]PJA02615.1 MAG: cysteine desulfurase CsdA [Gammaproteobacteria bacterium CG_4_10_14_0_2_um_filter_38_22]PJB11071.1 MAG: cysteine desulfurase CsdA [Gammaproteobacteria bacterium CG_4_9_14_3_um_filter_38_9]
MNYKTDFSIFKNNPGLVFLDSASSTQKPQCVIDAEMQFYEKNYANVHRGIYALSERATTAYENVRENIRDFIHAKHAHEIIFTKGTTESINLIAHSFGLSHIQSGDEVIISVMDHHSNIVPWQQVCERVGATLIVVPLLENGELDFDFYQRALNKKTKLVSLIHVSNVLGTINPVKKIIDYAHANNTPVLLDGAQAIPHMSVDMQALDCDFYVFSAHKLYGPTGVGVLYGKTKWLEKMPPYQTGGNMIRRVTFEKTEFNILPYKFEAGTPNIAGVIGLGAAIDYVKKIGFDFIASHEKKLLIDATQKLSMLDGLTIYGTTHHKSAVISFALNCAHPHDIATILDQHHVAVRAGHHCAMPLMDYLNVPALTRVSLGIYNSIDDIDQLVDGLKKVSDIFHE